MENIDFIVFILVCFDIDIIVLYFLCVFVYFDMVMVCEFDVVDFDYWFCEFV